MTAVKAVHPLLTKVATTFLFTVLVLKVGNRDLAVQGPQKNG
jgi:hypothetical protein